MAKADLGLRCSKYLFRPHLDSLLVFRNVPHAVATFSPHKGLTKNTDRALSDFILIITVLLASSHFTDVGAVVPERLAKMAELDSKLTRFHVLHPFPTFADGEVENINFRAQRSKLMECK